MKFKDVIIAEEKVRLDPKCWTGKKIGNPKTKMKGGVRVNNCVPAESVEEDWSQKYKDSINCANPKGFSQKAHCAGKKKNESVAESSQAVDSLVTDALKLMRGPEANDAVSALKTVLGNREYNQRRGHYNFYVRQMLDMYGQQGVAEGLEDRRRFIRHNIWTAMDSDEEVLQHAVEGDPFYSAKKFMRDLDDQGYDFTHVISPEGEITYSPQHDPRHLKNFPEQGVAEDLSRRGFLKGLGAAAAGAAGLGAAGAAQARATPEWMEKVAQAKELFNKGLSPEQVAKKLGVSGPNNNMAGPMGGDWGAINYAYREVQRSRGTGMNEESNPEYNDEAGMAHGSLLTVKRAVDGLMSTIDRGDDLPEWCQEKISLAEDYLVTVWDYIQSEKEQGVDPEIEEMYEAMDELAEEMATKKGVSVDLVWETFEAMDDNMLYETAAWRRKEGKSKTGGLNAKGVASYRRENPGSKLQTAVTTKPSKLKKGSKAAKRRKSFCARMSGVKGPMKKPNGKPTRKALALRKWNC